MFFLHILQVILAVQLEPIKVGRIEDLLPLAVADAPLMHQAERLESLRRKLNEKAKFRDEELAEAAREYTGSKLYEASQRILARLRED
jgi:hypothetical protein